MRWRAAWAALQPRFSWVQQTSVLVSIIIFVWSIVQPSQGISPETKTKFIGCSFCIGVGNLSGQPCSKINPHTKRHSNFWLSLTDNSSFRNENFAAWRYDANYISHSGGHIPSRYLLANLYPGIKGPDDSGRLSIVYDFIVDNEANFVGRRLSPYGMIKVVGNKDEEKLGSLLNYWRNGLDRARLIQNRFFPLQFTEKEKANRTSESKSNPKDFISAIISANRPSDKYAATYKREPELGEFSHRPSHDPLQLIVSTFLAGMAFGAFLGFSFASRAKR